MHFSTPTTQSDFSSINNKLIDGVPILLDGVGSIVCELWGSKGVGDHDVKRKLGFVFELCYDRYSMEKLNKQ